MNWENLAEKELDFYAHCNEYKAELEDRIKELEEDVRYPSVSYDEALGRISFYVPTVEEEVLRRERAREAIQNAFDRINKRTTNIERAFKSLTEDEQHVLYTYYFDRSSAFGSGRAKDSEICKRLDMRNVMTLQKAYKDTLEKFYRHILAQKKFKRERMELERKINLLRKDGLENSHKGRELQEMYDSVS